MTSIARPLLAFLGLLAFALWLPVAAAVYLPGWHAASCDWHKRCTEYGEERAQQRIDEVRGFMQHRADLPAVAWTNKERTHLAEVRALLDRAALAALLGAAIFFHAEARQRAAVARAAMLGVAGCVIVLPFFGTFWREIFHPLLFDNLMWKNYPADTSWWVMPRLYFQYTTGMVIGVATLLCAVLRYQAQREAQRETQREAGRAG